LATSINNLNLSKNHPMENEETEKLKFQNELEKLKMKAEFGANFSDGDSELPPEIEAEWLESVRKFEENFEKSNQKKIGELLGSPVFTPVTEIAPENIEGELEKILDMLGEKGIKLDHDEDVPVAELYRFITEELMDHETDVYDMPGWQTHIIYEEFYPNHEKDIFRHCENFCESLFKQKAEALQYELDSELVFSSGAVLIRDEFIEKAKSWFEAYDSFTVNRLLYKKPEYNLEQCMGHVHLFLDYDANLEDGSSSHFEGPGIFYLHYIHDYWMICGMDFPGFKEWAGV